MISQQEMEQLQSMSRPDNFGRLGSHELACKIILRLVNEIQELQQQVQHLKESQSGIQIRS